MTKSGNGLDAGQKLQKNAGDETVGEAASVASKTFKALTGQSLEEALNIRNWQPAERMAEQIHRLQAEIEAAMAKERITRKEIRAKIFPLLKTLAGAPANAGVHRVTLDQLREVQSSILFSGHVQAVDGASVVHQTMPITILQTAIALANYLGENGTWGHRIFKSDLRLEDRPSLDQVFDLLARRSKDSDDGGAGISDMLRRGFMAHAELNILATEAKAPWRMGHGHPLTKELLTGAGMPELIELALPLFYKLLLEHKRFVFVPRGSRDPLVSSIAGALLPLEYAIVQDVSFYLTDIITEGHYGTGKYKKAKEQLDAFQALAQHKIVMGIFRVSPHAPAQVFYAHADHAHEAALIAMADAVLVETRGFPMLLDIAGSLSREMFPSDAIFNPAAATYAKLARDAEGLAVIGPGAV